MTRPVLRWLTPAAIAFVVAATGVVGMGLARAGVVPASPWAYVFLACAGVGAVAGLLMAVARAHRVADKD